MNATLRPVPSPNQAREAILRLWAANVRDRTGPHATIGERDALLAGVLCNLLDLRGTILAGENGRGLLANVEQTIRKIRTALEQAGVTQPKM